MNFELDNLEAFKSRSQSFEAEYLENGVRYSFQTNTAQIGNHIWPVDWRHDVSHWMTVKRPKSRSQSFEAE